MSHALEHPATKVSPDVFVRTVEVSNRLRRSSVHWSMEEAVSSYVHPAVPADKIKWKGSHPEDLQYATITLRGGDTVVTVTRQTIQGDDGPADWVYAHGTPWAG